ncbi:hypothetical protein DIPPA_08815 [Diplonema papillatum]|nr:hypothetical protein DIPPA_08815 [Diplonema papillatum]
MFRYSEDQLRQKVAASLVVIKKVLDTSRNPQLAEYVHHTYDDKYLLAEFVTKGLCASNLTCLKLLGLTDESLQTIKGWSNESRSVTLRLSSRQGCSFVENRTREIDSATKESVTVGGLGITRKTVTTIHESVWRYTCAYELFVFKGSNPSDRIVLGCREDAETVIILRIDTPPYEPETEFPALDVDVSWLVSTIDAADSQVSFGINRSHSLCHTPRRNEGVAKAVRHANQLSAWCSAATARLFGFHGAMRESSLDLAALDRSPADFVPLAPLLEEPQPGPLEPPAGVQRVEAGPTPAAGAGACQLPPADLEALLLEETRFLARKLGSMDAVFRGAGAAAPFSAAEARVVAVLRHAADAAAAYVSSVDYLENLLRRQLVAAIGKTVTCSEFTAYMQFHCRKIFNESHAPAAFCRAIRRVGHSPEGTISINAKVDDASGESPVRMLSREFASGEVPGMRFALNAAAEVVLRGPVFAHACVNYRFSTEAPPPLTLVSRSRQFSGYVLLLGRIAGAGLFLPSHAMLVMNKDEFEIALNLHEIPSAQEFKDATQALSPEQQRFARAYRSMQLESTLFAVCAVQIKPQLELVLNLPDDSLTKEIQLTQQLIELFTRYHIPPDLLSFQCDALEDPSDIPPSVKVEMVKKQVAAMFKVISVGKQAEIDDAKQRKGPVSPASSTLQPFPVIRGQTTAKEPTSSCATQYGSESGTSPTFDVTQIPKLLEAQFARHATAASIRPTIIQLSSTWTKRHHPQLLSPVVVDVLAEDGQRLEKSRAFDLLDCLTRSGALPVQASEVHTIIGATHCFDETLIETIVQNNVNPIERVELSTLIIASTLFEKHPRELLTPSVAAQVQKYSPMLFVE